MNRSLVIPAICSLFAFGAVVVALQGAPRSESQETAEKTVAKPSVKETALGTAEAELLLTKLTGEYLQPWRKYETSPQRLYSRAMPRPIPSISASVELAAQSGCQSDHVLVATVVIKTGPNTQRIPCVVDRENSDVRFFAGDQWVTSADWLKSAPLPF